MTLQYPLPLLALALYSGIGFACVGIGYRFGQARGVSTSAVALLICAAGVGSFALQSRLTLLDSVPGYVWLLGALAGLGQFGAVKLIGPALARGPLSPMWCALNLNFVVVILYARGALGEAIAPLRYAGLALAVACVLAASLGQRPAAGEEKKLSGGRLVYGALLAGIVVCNAVWVTAIKDLSARPVGESASYMSRFGGEFSMTVYLVLGLLLAADLLRQRREAGLRRALTPGLLAAAGSVTGVWALGVAGVLPAGVAFTLNSVASILTAAIVSVAAFREPRTPMWYATVSLAVLAVAAVNVPGRAG